MECFWFITLLVCYYVTQSYCSVKPTDVQYIVAIDAGSAGSRAAAYKFHVNRLNEEVTLDDDEKFAKISGGLGGYINNCSEGAKTIKGLLDTIKKELQLEPDVLAKTPVVLGGTGGLRNIQPQDADNLLTEVRKVFKDSGFLVKDNAASVIDGVDEGIFSWFAVNYILGRWGSKNTAVTLDVGGASIELSFPLKKETTDQMLNEYLYTLSTGNGIFNPKTDIFSISYCNLGARAVRKLVFSHGNLDGATDLHTICMHPNNKPSTFPFGTVTYTVHGLPNENSVVDFDACMKLVQEKTLNLLTPKPSPLKHENEIYVFSGFFSTFKETGLIDPVEGGQANLSTILTSAKKACSVQDDKNPFLCIDLIYMHVLLSDGFELKPETKVNFLQKLKGHNISWTVGFAYDLLAGLKREKKTIRK